MLGMLEAVRGCLKEEMRMDVISNNLANATSAGFKRDRISFQRILSQMPQGAEQTGSDNTSPSNPSLVAIETDFTQGEVRATGNSLDFSISGKGFFKVNTPGGIRYTRKGNFALDLDGYLITQKGERVMGKNGAINIWGDQIEVDKRGRILVEGSEVDRLDVVDLSEPEKLIKESGLLFRAPPEIQELSLDPEAMIQQGYLEDSNVNVAEEMVNMIHATRAFESYQKAMQVLDRLDNKATNEVSRLR
jgi:flagellar basal-body rod protein FlgF